MSFWQVGPYERDASINDFGPPQELYYQGKGMTKEEEADYFDKLAEMDNDTIIW